jgi:hypothetical protein
MVCREKKYGCRLKLKARWQSGECPKEQWPPVVRNSDEQPITADGSD